MQKKIVLLGAVFLLFMALVGYIYARQYKATQVPTVVDTDQEAFDDTIAEEAVSTGEDPWVELERLIAVYSDKEGLSYKGMIRLIDDTDGEEKLVGRYPFEYQSHNGVMKYTADSNIFVRQEQFIALVDQRAKIVVLSAATKAAVSPGIIDFSKVKEMMQMHSLNAVVSEAKGVKMLTIDSIQDAQVQGYRIYYNPQTYEVQKLLVGMLRSEPLDGLSRHDYDGQGVETDGELKTQVYEYYLEIDLNSLKRKAGSGNGLKPLEDMIIFQGDSIALRPAFSQYQLVNLVNQ